jgi:hypothetical protein
VAAFRAKLSDPTALKTHFSYHYSASLIADGLANGTDPVYVYTTPQCDPQPVTDGLLSFDPDIKLVLAYECCLTDTEGLMRFTVSADWRCWPRMS